MDWDCGIILLQSDCATCSYIMIAASAQYNLVTLGCKSENCFKNSFCHLSFKEEKKTWGISSLALGPLSARNMRTPKILAMPQT
jgi:hypothetical protein